MPRYEMVTGKRAFEGQSQISLASSILKDSPRPPSALQPIAPDSLDHVVLTCLHKAPSDRWQSAADLGIELRWIAEQQAAAPKPAAPQNKRRRRTYAVPAAFFLVLAVWGAVAAYRHEAVPPMRLWLSIPAPDGAAGKVLEPAVSPDGKRIAFSQVVSGKSTVWVRDLDAPSARMISGVEGAVDLFWSPDGDWLGYYSQAKLQKINVGGGPPQKLADIYNPRGATWSKDGVILFSPAPDLGLYRVPDSGGAVTPVPTAPNAARSMYPSFLPDGQHFLYRNLHDHEWWINVGSLDGKTDKPLLKAPSHAQYANGYLLFGREGSLWAQPFDPVRLEISGVPVRVGDASFSGSDYVLSVAGGTLALAVEHLRQWSQLTWSDDNGKTLDTIGKAGNIMGFSIAPDRTRAVYEQCGSPNVDACDAWIMNLKSGYSNPLTTLSPGGDATSPIWFPHADRILFIDMNDAALRIVPAAGGTGEQWPTAQGWPSSISPDGQFLLVNVENSVTKNDINLINLKENHQVTAYLNSPFNEFSAKFSPDGHWVAYVSDESGDLDFEIYVRPFPQSGSEGKVRISQKGGEFPEWSDDGKHLYFLAAEPNGKWSMMIADVPSAGALPRKLFVAPAVVQDFGRSQYAIFDKGHRFLFNAALPDNSPPTITVGVNWFAGLKK